MLRFENISKSYGGRLAVDQLNLDIQQGEIFGLLGPNGAGKSTSIHLAVGLIDADSGRVLFHDEDTHRADVRQRLGIAPQKLSLYEELSGRENLEFFARIYGYRGSALATRVDAALDFVQLSDRQKDKVSEYSGGMQRRLNIAAAIVHEPQLVLLDEPTVGVDPQSRNAIFDKVIALKDEGKTVIYTTHYMEEAQRLCDRIAIMDHGKLLALGTPKALIREHGGSPVLIAQRGDEEIQVETHEPLRTLNELAQAQPISSFQLQQPSLEQVFLNLTGRSLRD